ncbi:imidazole glycerol phosphate synthase subunit HisH [Dactylosporangium vinaceum]|uniref:Imidazole glycerol phosphate synthase subunit HisH n=1 Tax=Dactylosporangium vinaceum TaxID=53362 RepID=A0ABV5MGT0_9ACTN|nr:imidazole glycerol phosphate synthase subunit HisH [Dactylosporangium vinaceum]UAB94968.1 imidazole glycerol phosphate synthase subunit HisH [Dactylosporangium vinaceum]
MAKKVVILDYGSGNLRSAERAVARVGADVEVTADLEKAARADGLVVPGVGAYAACMAGVDELGAGPVIAERVRVGAPVLGICVGMQIMFDEGEEHGVVTKGLGLAPGAVTRLHAPVVPHMGWNTVAWPEGSVLGAGLPQDTRFYFVHSYAATTTSGRVATTVHGEQFVAAFETDVLRATQFHPEKSGDAGATLLRSWLGTL